MTDAIEDAKNDLRNISHTNSTPADVIRKFVDVVLPVFDNTSLVGGDITGMMGLMQRALEVQYEVMQEQDETESELVDYVSVTVELTSHLLRNTDSWRTLPFNDSSSNATALQNNIDYTGNLLLNHMTNLDESELVFTQNSLGRFTNLKILYFFHNREILNT